MGAGNLLKLLVHYQGERFPLRLTRESGDEELSSTCTDPDTDIFELAHSSQGGTNLPGAPQRIKEANMTQGSD